MEEPRNEFAPPTRGIVMHTEAVAEQQATAFVARVEAEVAHATQGAVLAQVAAEHAMAGRLGHEARV